MTTPLLYRGVPEATRRKVACNAWRERGFSAGMVNAPRLSDERLRELDGDEAVQAYHQGIRAAERELRRRAEAKGDATDA